MKMMKIISTWTGAGAVIRRHGHRPPRSIRSLPCGERGGAAGRLWQGNESHGEEAGRAGACVTVSPVASCTSRTSHLHHIDVRERKVFVPGLAIRCHLEFSHVEVRQMLNNGDTHGSALTIGGVCVLSGFDVNTVSSLCTQEDLTVSPLLATGSGSDSCTSCDVLVT